MSIPLTSTRYLLTTDDLLVGWDQKSWIEGADDRQAPDTQVSSFDELEEAATSGGPSSEAQEVLDQIMAVLSRDAVLAEQWLESFCIDIYEIPLTIVDGVAKKLMIDWMRHGIKVRHDLYRNPETEQAAETALTNRARMIRNDVTKLSATRVGMGSNSNEDISAWGSDSRREETFLGPFTFGRR